MLATKNRFGAVMVALLAAGVFLVACAPPGPRALLEGRDQLESGNTAAAIQHLKTATGLMPTNAAAWNYLGVAYHRAGQWTNAVEAYARALRYNRELLEVRFNLGCLWLEQDKLDAARTEFTAYTLRRPNSGEGWVKLGTTQLRARDPAAEKSFREALRVNPRDVEALNGLGLVFAQRNRPREAADSFAAALQQRPDYRPALLNLATVLQQQLNDPAAALKRYREYLALQPRDSDWEVINAIARSLEPPAVAPIRPAPSNNIVVVPVLTNLARQAVAAIPQPAALPKLEPQPISPKPTASTATVARAASTPTPQPPEVVKLAPEPVIKTTPDDKPAITRIPQPAVQMLQADAASVDTTPPSSVQPPERRGLLSKLNPFKREPKPSVPSTASVEVTIGPLMATPGNPVSPGRYQYVLPTAPAAGDRRAAEQAVAFGQEAHRARRLSEAIQYFRRATQADASCFEAHYSLGLAMFEAQNFKAAAAEWETAIALRPDSWDARYNFALTLKAAGYYQDAVVELEKLLGLHPNEARAHLTLGNLHADQLADKLRARYHYQQVLQLEPRHPQAQAIRYWLVANPG